MHRHQQTCPHCYAIGLTVFNAFPATHHRLCREAARIRRDFKNEIAPLNGNCIPIISTPLAPRLSDQTSPT